MIRQNYYGQLPAENLLDRQAGFPDGRRSFTDGMTRRFCAGLCETELVATGQGEDNQFPGQGPDNQVPDPGSVAVRIPSATSGRIPILTYTGLTSFLSSGSRL